MTPSTKKWLRDVLAEAARSQDDPRRDAAFQEWKSKFASARKAKRGGGRGERGKLDLLFPKTRRTEGGSDGEAVG